MKHWLCMVSESRRNLEADGVLQVEAGSDIDATAKATALFQEKKGGIRVSKTIPCIEIPETIPSEQIPYLVKVFNAGEKLGTRRGTAAGYHDGMLAGGD